MDARTLARQQALGRVVVGAGLTFAPRLAGSGKTRDEGQAGADDDAAEGVLAGERAGVH